MRPAAPYRRLLRTLTVPQMTLADVSLATGLDHHTLNRIRNGDSDYLKHSTSVALDRLLDVLPSEESA